MRLEGERTGAKPRGNVGKFPAKRRPLFAVTAFGQRLPGIHAARRSEVVVGSEAMAPLRM